MSWKIIFTKRSEKDFKSLTPKIQRIIQKAINDKLLANPDLNLLPLKGKLSGIYKFRVGKYRILCEKRSDILVIIIVKIGHRKAVY